MASHAEAAVTQAIQALVDRDDALAAKVEANDSVLDQFEMELDELCIDLLALKSPVASDLRLITAAMKISQNLERVGDEATAIARRVIELNREPPLNPFIELPRMSGLATHMLKQALDAFVNGDTSGARAIILQDQEVDALNKHVYRELAKMMAENPQAISRSLDLMIISKCLERIGDHATNVAEEVVYYYEARDIRHSLKHAPASLTATGNAAEPV